MLLKSHSKYLQDSAAFGLMLHNCPHSYVSGTVPLKERRTPSLLCSNNYNNRTLRTLLKTWPPFLNMSYHLTFWTAKKVLPTYLLLRLQQPQNSNSRHWSAFSLIAFQTWPLHIFRCHCERANQITPTIQPYYLLKSTHKNSYSKLIDHDLWQDWRNISSAIKQKQSSTWECPSSSGKPIFPMLKFSLHSSYLWRQKCVPNC